MEVRREILCPLMNEDRMNDDVLHCTMIRLQIPTSHNASETCSNTSRADLKCYPPWHCLNSRSRFRHHQKRSR